MPILPVNHAVECFFSSYSELEATLKNPESPKKRDPVKEWSDCRRFVDRFVQNALDIEDLEEAPGLTLIPIFEQAVASERLRHIDAVTKENRPFAVERMAFTAVGALFGSLIALHQVISKHPNGNSKLDEDKVAAAVKNELYELQQAPRCLPYLCKQDNPAPSIILENLILRINHLAENTASEDFRVPPLVPFFKQEINAYETYLKNVINLRPLETAAVLADEIKQGAGLGSLTVLRAWLVSPWLVHCYQINSNN